MHHKLKKNVLSMVAHIYDKNTSSRDEILLKRVFNSKFSIIL